MEDIYIGEKVKSIESIYTNQNKKVDRKSPSGFGESEASSDDEERKFKPKPKLEKGTKMTRGSRGARGKVGRGRNEARRREKSIRTTKANGEGNSGREKAKSSDEETGYAFLQPQFQDARKNRNKGQETGPTKRGKQKYGIKDRIKKGQAGQVGTGKGTRKRVQDNKQSTGKTTKVGIEQEEDIYIGGEEHQFSKNTYEDEARNEDTQATHLTGVATASTEQREREGLHDLDICSDEESNFEPKSKKKKGSEVRRGILAMRGKVGRGRGRGENKGTDVAKERIQLEVRKTSKGQGSVKQDDNISEFMSAHEYISLKVGRKEYSVRMNEKGNCQCPFCDIETNQVKKHFRACVKNKLGRSEQISTDFFVRVEAKKRKNKTGTNEKI